MERRPSQAAKLPAFPAPKAERSYADMNYPSVEYRLLAAFKIWGVFKYFFAYRDLLDEDWDQVLLDYLPKFIAAKDALEYNLAVAEMVTHVHDSHAFVSSKELTAYFGAAPLPLQLRLIDKKVVVTRIYDDAATSAGIQVGDIVHSVDGEDIAETTESRGEVSGGLDQSMAGIRDGATSAQRSRWIDCDAGGESRRGREGSET